MGGGRDGCWRGAFHVAQREQPSRVEGRCKFVGCLPSDVRVRTRAVVIGAPYIEPRAGLGQGREPRLVEEFIAKAAVEALPLGS